MKSRLCLPFLLFFIFLAFPVFSQETMTITTYYPSPYGSYNELTTFGNTFLSVTSGSVGIGTTNPLSKLDVRGIITTDSNVYLATVAGTRVGIGTTAPSQTLSLVTAGPQNMIGITVGARDLQLGVDGSVAKIAAVQPNNDLSICVGGLNNEVMRFVSGAGIGLGLLGGNVGIGTTNPSTARLQVNQATANQNGLFVRTAATGSANYGFRFENGSSQVVLRVQCDRKVGINVDNPSDALTVGLGPITPVNNNDAITTLGKANKIWGATYTGTPATANLTVPLYIDSVTNMITTTNNPSSRKYKEDIQDLKPEIYQKVLALKPVSFKWKANKQEDVGLVAEDVNEVMKELVTYQDGEPRSVKYDKVAIYLLGVVKDQQAELDSLKKELAELKAKLK